MPEVETPLTPSAGTAIRSRQLLTALAVLVVFNAFALAAFIATGLPAQTWVFVAWFVGDVIVGLIALGLTDPG